VRKAEWRARCVIEAKLSIGVTLYAQLALVQQAMMRRAQNQAIRTRVLPAVRLFGQMVHVDVATPVAARGSATTMIAQHGGASHCGGQGAAGRGGRSSSTLV